MSRLRREIVKLDRALVETRKPYIRWVDDAERRAAVLAALNGCRGAVEKRLRALAQTSPSVYEYARVYWQHLNRLHEPGVPFDEYPWLSEAARSLPKSTKIEARQMIDRICGFGRRGV